MKWSYLIQQKMKAALLLGSVMVLIMVSTLHSQHNLRDIHRSFASIYQDRLMPAIDFVYLTEHMYRKRLLLEQHLLLEGHGTPGQIRQQLGHHNLTIDSLVGAFEKTHLVAQESKSLLTFKNYLQEYQLLEDHILRLSAVGDQAASVALFEQQGTLLFQQAITNLNELTQLQSTIGQELMNESESEMANMALMTSLQVALSIVVGIMLLGIIRSSRILPKHSSQPFHLN
ncbi:hypothetical protein GCM10027275_48870 [Rhabdobacter roseus]|uniref:Chemotaxis methyl-accepting receptor HlyB-like 4HB MCP domain-containing protein n=1 Tax=Rhabdobacter roseus TaxID=1655419 RepID=A0A840TSM6_9BACT|nr:MCP four helix bundle domain-containing protein [Rhabdobacter roseus]MBB5286951.1 hypothetical protein [Rhabdobacter roseus]